MGALTRPVAGILQAQPLVFRSGGDGGRVAPPGPFTMARLRVRRFILALRGRQDGGGEHGGPAGPNGDTGSEDAWNDPALWMLMFH